MKAGGNCPKTFVCSVRRNVDTLVSFKTANFLISFVIVCGSAMALVSRPSVKIISPFRELFLQKFQNRICKPATSSTALMGLRPEAQNKEGIQPVATLNVTQLTVLRQKCTFSEAEVYIFRGRGVHVQF